MVQTYQTQTTYQAPFAVLAPSYFLRYPNPYATHVLSTDVLERRIVYRRQQVDTSSAGDGPSSSSSSSSPSSVVRPVLLTSRLILKKGTLPSWAPRGLMKTAESWVLEVSEVDLDGDIPTSRIIDNGGTQDTLPSGSAPVNEFTKMYPPRGQLATPPGEEESFDRAGKVGRQMRTWTRNLDHTTILAVAEALTFTEVLPGASGPGSSSSVLPAQGGKGKGRDQEIQGSQPSTAPAFLPTHCLISAHVTSDVSVLWNRIEKFGIKRFKTHIDTSRQGLLHTSSLLSHSISPFSQSLTPPRRSGPFATLRESLRPPWLDGLPLSPLTLLHQRLHGLRESTRVRWDKIKEDGIWGTGRRVREESMAEWRRRVRERLVKARDGKWWNSSSSTSTSPPDTTGATGTSTPSPEQGHGEEVELAELPRERASRLAREAKGEGR